MSENPKFKTASYLLNKWAKNSVRPTRNGEQIKKYTSKADIKEMIAAYAFVNKFNGFPHETRFHTLMPKISSGEIEEASILIESRIWMLAEENEGGVSNPAARPGQPQDHTEDKLTDLSAVSNN